MAVLSVPPGHLTAEPLHALLSELLAPYQPELGATLDEVMVRIEGPHVLEAARLLHDEPRLAFDYVRCLSGVDLRDAPGSAHRFEVVYHLYSTVHRHRLTLKAAVPEESSALPSVISVWRGADWHEREAAEMYGLTFEGHPNLVQLLLWDGAPFAPQRKDVPVLPLEEFWKDMGLEEREAEPEEEEARPAAPRRLTAREQKQRLLAQQGATSHGDVAPESGQAASTPAEAATTGETDAR
jgi:NADH-quinone oxidoreductase subunit C